MNSTIIKKALFNACATALYVGIIATFLFYAPKAFGSQKADTVLVPIMMLSLLVFSAALTGALIFGTPVLWYLDGKKKEAVQLLFSTLGIFLVLTIIVMCAVFFIQ